MNARRILDLIPHAVLDANDRIMSDKMQRPLDARVVAAAMRRVFEALVNELHEEANGIDKARQRAEEARRRAAG